MRSRKKRVFWIFATVSAVLLIAFLPNYLTYDARHPVQLFCAVHLKHLGIGCMAYANEHGGRFPDSVEDLIGRGEVSPDDFICPNTSDTVSPGASVEEKVLHLHDGNHLSYIYVGKGLTTSIANASDVVLAYEPPSNHGGRGGDFLYADGHVEFQPAPYGTAWFPAPIPATRPTTAP